MIIRMAQVAIEAVPIAIANKTARYVSHGEENQSNITACRSMVHTAADRETRSYNNSLSFTTNP